MNKTFEYLDKMELVLSWFGIFLGSIVLAMCVIGYIMLKV